MRKLLLTLFAVLSATFVMGQKVTLDFTSNSWGLPEGSAQKTATAATFTSGGYTIRLEGDTGNGYYWNTDKYLILGKANATLTLPAFKFAVGKIVITGRNGASGTVGTNIFVGDNAVSTELAGCTGVNTYEIADAYQAAGNVYTLKVLTKHNMQIVKIDIYEVGDDGGEGGGEGGGDTPTLQDISNKPESAYTVSQAINFINNKETYDLSKEVYVKGEVGEVAEISVEHGNATYTLMDVTGATLTIYRGKYLKNKAFTNAEQIQDGDEAVVFGKLILYKNEGEDDQYQMAQGNYLYSKNGETEPEEEDITLVTVSEAQAAAAGTVVALQGTVYALCTTGAVLGDKTGFIYYYNKNIADMKWNIGDQGTISGAVSAYGGFNQFTNTAEVEYIGHTDVTYPTPVELDVDAWVAQPAIQYVTLTGTLNVSGNYYNIVVDGKTAQGIIVGAMSDMFAGIESGATVTIEGFAMYSSTSKAGATYVNIIATKVTVDGEGGEGEGGGGDDTPDPVVDGDNLLANGSFEEWVSDEEPTGWKSTNSASSNATTAKSTDKHSGNYAVEVKGIASSNKRMASKEIKLEAGTYTFSIWMKSAGEASVAKMGYAYMDGEYIKYAYFKDESGAEVEFNVTPEYTEYMGTFTLEAATTVNIVVMNNKKSNAVSIIADDACLTKAEGSGEQPELPSAEDIAFTENSLTWEIGTSQTLPIILIPDYAVMPSILWSSTNGNVATVDGNGTVTATGVGTTVIVAYAPTLNKSVMCTLTVYAMGDVNMTGNWDNSDIHQLARMVVGLVDANEAADVNRDGQVTVADVTKLANAIANGRYPGWQLSLSESSLIMDLDEVVRLTAHAYPAGVSLPSLTWTSSDENVAEVTANGLVSAIGYGTCTITCAANDGSGNVATCEVTVPIHVTGINLSANSLTLPKASSQTLTATILPAEATLTGLDWTSSDENIAIVDDSGQVTGIGTGTCTITCSATDGSGVTATCEVTVWELVLSETTLNLEVDGFQKLNVSTNPSSVTVPDVTWTTSDPNVADVNSRGLVYAMGAGTCTITCTATDGSGLTATCTINVNE